MDNSFLFDIKSGVVVGADTRQRNDATLEQVIEYLSRFLEFRELYKYGIAIVPCSRLTLKISG